MDDFIDDDEDEDDEDAAARKAERRARKEERRQARRGPVMSEEAVQQRMSEIYDPDTLKQHFHTEPDERIRQKDVPERLQLIFEKREPAAPNEFPKEAQWMYPLLFSTAAEEEAEPAQVELRLESVRTLLSILREGEATGPDAEDGTPAPRVHLEPATVQHFRKELWRPAGISEAQLRRLVDLDAQYGHLQVTPSPDPDPEPQPRPRAPTPTPTPCPCPCP